MIIFKRKWFCTVILSQNVNQEFDGLLAVFGVKAGVDEAAFKSSLSSVTEDISIDLNAHPAVIRFGTHQQALQAKTLTVWSKLCDGVDVLYNDRSYDGSNGKDKGRGW